MSHGVLLGIVVMLVSMIGGLTAGFAQDKQLIDAAKKEGGKVVVYGSLENDTMDLLAAAFKKKTGLDVDYWRDSANKVTDRVSAESRAGKPQADVVLTTTSTLRLIQKDGLLAKYDSPAAKAFPQTVIDPNLGPAYRSTVIGVVYNTGIIKPGEAPKSVEDLVKPQYKGKVVFPDPSQHTTTAQWLASLHKIIGQERAEKFIHDLAASKPLLVSSLTPAGERITTGETPIGVAFLKNVVFYGRNGVPLDYVRSGKFMGDGQSITMANKAPHVNAGKAFIDYFLGEESLKIMANIGEFVTRKGIYPPLPDANKIQLVDMIDMDKDAFAHKMAEYKKIFLQN
ncbi:MAG TPA: extracellular solute-binding protein [Candidatus Limnocylindrales bacterium]|nr:extracellular solute-binding protein [Candidatus Limnocylindrales bacterium]